MRILLIEDDESLAGKHVEMKVQDNNCNRFSRRTRSIVLLVLCCMSLVAVAFAVDTSIAEEPPPSDRLHILVPGGAGGGWDTTARAVGEALRRADLLERVSYENRSGGGGGVALAHFIETAERQKDSVFVGSTALVIRSLHGLLPQGLDNLVPIASVVADYGALVVRADLPYSNFAELSDALEREPRAIKVAGGSVRGGMDHLIVESIMVAAGHRPGAVAYVAYDAGGQAFTSLLSGETQALSTGVSEVTAAHKQGQVRILAITAPERLPELPDVPTFRELNIDVEFANWRGFFGPPGMTREERDRAAEPFAELLETPEWERQRQRLALTNFLRLGADFERFLELNRRQVRQLIHALGEAETETRP